MTNHVYDSVEKLINYNDYLMFYDDDLCNFFEEYDEYKIIQFSGKNKDVFYVVYLENDEVNVMSMKVEDKVRFKKVKDCKIKNDIIKTTIFN